MRFFTFSNKVIVSAVLALMVGFGAYATYSDYVQQKTAAANLQRFVENVGDGAASQIGEWIGSRVNLVEVAVQALGGPGAITDVDQLIKLPLYANLFALTYFGESSVSVFHRSPNVQMPPGYDFRTREVYKASISANGVRLADPYIDAATGELVTSITSPVYSGKDLLGVFGVDLTLKSVVDFILAQDIGGLGYAFLVNENGQIIATPDDRLQGKMISEVYGKVVGKLESRPVETILDGSLRILSFKPIPGLPGNKWYVGLSVDERLAYAEIKNSRKSALVAFLIISIFFVMILGSIVSYLLKPLRSLNLAMKDIALGDSDLTKRIASSSNDEFGDLSSSFNAFVERISSSIVLVGKATNELTVYSRQVLDESRTALVSSEDQADRVLVIAASIEELGATAHEIASSAAQGASEATSVRKMSEEGVLLSNDSVRMIETLSVKVASSKVSIENLSLKTDKIGAILDVIKGISEQTNLLALNAAIEAARAGEAGRGFAVVADEVRNLAHRTQVSALEINQMISELQGDVRIAVDCMLESQAQGDASVALIKRAGEGIEQLTQGVSEMDRMNLSVAAATEEQSSVVVALGSDIDGVNSRNREFVEGLHRNIRSCAGLDEQALLLQKLVSGFKV